jgi:hypothetical protein
MKNFSFRHRISFGLTLTLLSSGASNLLGAFSNDTKLPGPKSPYTQILLKAHKDWATLQAHIPAEEADPLTIRCIETPGEEFYVGLEQHMTVAAPMESVDKVISDLDNYKNLFPGFEDVKIIEKNENLWTSEWEQIIPVFFIPNIKYQMSYLIDHSQKDRSFYRYQLKESGNIYHFDGLIVLERVNTKRTKYTEFDFYNANYGPLKVFAPSSIWKDGVHDLVQSDFAVKLKSENPDWDYAKIKKQSETLADAFPIEPALKNKVQVFPWGETTDQKLSPVPK